MGYPARATHGQGGHITWGELDLTGGHVQVEPMYGDPKERPAPEPITWHTVLLSHLLSSPIDQINQLARNIEAEGYPITTECKYSIFDNYYWIEIDKIEYRLHRNKITKLHE